MYMYVKACTHYTYMYITMLELEGIQCNYMYNYFTFQGFKIPGIHVHVHVVDGWSL